MAYLVANMAKYKEGDLSAVGAESTRNLKSYKNKVNTNKSNENEYWRKDGKDDNFKIAINREIMNRWEKRQVPRKDAVRLVGVVVSASPEVFENLTDVERKEKAVKFSNDATEYMSGRFGEENLFSAALHMDETTPHVQFGIVPMVDGGLSAKKMFNRQALQDLHDGKGDNGFIKFMNDRGWDLEVEPKDRSAKHVDPDKYNAAQEELKKINDEIGKKKRVLAGMSKKANTLYDDKKEDGFSQGYEQGYLTGYSNKKQDLEKKEEDLREKESAFNDKERNMTENVEIRMLERFEDREDELRKKEEEARHKQAVLDKQQQDLLESQKYVNARGLLINERVARFSEVVEKVGLSETYQQALKNYVNNGKTGIQFAKTKAKVPVEAVTGKIDKKRTEKHLKDVAVQEDDGPEL